MQVDQCLFPLSFQLKITPPLTTPAQFCYEYFKECFMLSQQVRKIKSNIEYSGKGEEK